jgi:hypothetical protein
MNPAGELESDLKQWPGGFYPIVYEDYDTHNLGLPGAQAGFRLPAAFRQGAKYCGAHSLWTVHER